MRIMKQITIAEQKIASTPPERRQSSRIAKLVDLQILCEHNMPTPEEMKAAKHFMEQLCLTGETKTEFEAILKKHEGDSAREFVKATENHGADQQVYHGGMIVRNYCMTFGKHGGLIIESMTKAMKPKLKDADNIEHL